MQSMCHETVECYFNKWGQAKWTPVPNELRYSGQMTDDKTTEQQGRVFANSNDLVLGHLRIKNTIPKHIIFVNNEYKLIKQYKN